MGEKLKLPGKVGEAATGGALIPEGQYAWEVIKASVHKGSKSDEPFLRVNIKCISDGPFKGIEPFPDQLSAGEKAFWKLASFLKACGAPDDVEAIDTDNLKGMKYIAATVHDKYEGAPRNKYLNYMVWSEDAAKAIAGPSKEATEVKDDENVATDWGKK